ncbi:MAG: hypothetical protein HZA54_08175 [Planctomycetes bacterium]|nr:hypothetical protein [Planctomycetota bacterium]
MGLADALAHVACRLRARGLQAYTVAVALAYSDGVRAERRRLLPRPSDLDGDLRGPVERVFEELYTRRIRLRKVTLTLSHLVPPDGQLTLFAADPRAGPRRALFAALDRLRVRHGWQSVGFGRAGLAESGPGSNRGTRPAPGGATPGPDLDSAEGLRPAGDVAGIQDRVPVLRSV